MDHPELIDAEALVGDEGLLSAAFFIVTASLLKKESNCPRSSSDVHNMETMRTRMFRVNNCSVFSCQRALCVTSQAEGNGGWGAEFIA